MEPLEPINSGLDLALRMIGAYAGRDWVELLAVRAKTDRETVERHLQDDKPPPKPILVAAAELLDEVTDG